MEKGYVVQGEVYAEPVLEAEVVTAEPIMGEVVGEVVPSATDHLPEALDGAPRLALVAAGSADALRFDNAATLRAGGGLGSSHRGTHPAPARSTSSIAPAGSAIACLGGM